MNTHYYYIDYLHTEIYLEQKDIEAIPLSGSADEACSVIADKSYIKRQFKDISFARLKDTVCKLCDNPKIKSRKEAIMYLIWIAALDIKENGRLCLGCPNLKVCSDGFVWLVITPEEARKLWNAGVFSLYVLYDDESEAMIEREIELEDYLDKGLQIGIEVGFLSRMEEERERSRN